MARSDYLLGRVKTRRALKAQGHCTVSAYEFHCAGNVTMRYTNPVVGPVKSMNVKYRIKITLKETALTD